MTGTTVLGLDVGSVRVGVATARLDVRLPQPLITLQYGPEIFAEVVRLAQESDAAAIVVGWPRGLNGQQTAQTTFVDSFVAELSKHTVLPVQLQDEALTSTKAEAELQSRKRPYAKGEVDALAATYILEDYLQSAGVAADV